MSRGFEFEELNFDVIKNKWHEILNVRLIFHRKSSHKQLSASLIQLKWNVSVGTKKTDFRAASAECIWVSETETLEESKTKISLGNDDKKVVQLSSYCSCVSAEKYFHFIPVEVEKSKT